MITQPKVVARDAQPYVGLSRTVKIPFGDVVDATMPKLFQWLGEHGVEPVGPPFFKYNVIDMARGLEIEFAAPTAAVQAGGDGAVAGELPAGRYATLTHHGPYDQLMAATAALLDWIEQQGLAVDAAPSPEGDRFVARFEVYTNDPREVPDPKDWETELWMKLKD